MKPIKLKELLRTAKDPATQKIVIDEGLGFDAPLFDGVVKDVDETLGERILSNWQVEIDGTPLNPSTINEWLDKLTERNGLPHVTVHSLRHLCATLLIRTHADPKTVQTILRHANVSTTLNIYAKVFDSTQMEAIGRVQASLENMLKESCSSSAQV